MEERTIEEVIPIEEAEGIDEATCTREHCNEPAEKEVTQTYESRYGKSFIWLCGGCLAEYTKKYDRAQIYGDGAI